VSGNYRPIPAINTTPTALDQNEHADDHCGSSLEGIVTVARR